jgi:hypothetical protein
MAERSIRSNRSKRSSPHLLSSPASRLCRNAIGALRQAQGERISTRNHDRGIPFVVSLSNHERYCDTVSTRGRMKEGFERSVLRDPQEPESTVEGQRLNGWNDLSAL